MISFRSTVVIVVKLDQCQDSVVKSKFASSVEDEKSLSLKTGPGELISQQGISKERLACELTES